MKGDETVQIIRLHGLDTVQALCVSPQQQQRPAGQQVNTQLIKSERAMDQCVQSSLSSQCHLKQEAEQQRADGFPQLQQISNNLATDLYNVSDRSPVGNILNVNPPTSTRSTTHTSSRAAAP